MVDHELINIRQDEQIDLHKLKNYLNELLKIDIDKINILQFSGGHANLTYLISFNNKEFVLRRPPLGPVAPSSHDMAREHMVQHSLNKLFPLAPKSIHLCEDDEIIGSKFHLIERRKGIVIRKEMRSELDGSRNKIRSLSFKMIDVLAQLHTLDPSKAGLGNFGDEAQHWHAGCRQRRQQEKNSGRSRIDAGDIRAQQAGSMLVTPVKGPTRKQREETPRSLEKLKELVKPLLG